ncbi:MAG: hypothetical protein KGD57_06260 [Candidatus Lokiarchaeota archaeon]|nr:hypothetical protein [Candidatus Lokiarchaeota archaeon]
MLNRRDFYHQNIRYSFHYHKERLNRLNQRNNGYRKIDNFFKKIYNGNIPNDVFNMKNTPRISHFRIKGIKKAFLMSFEKKLIRTNKIKKFHSDFKLSSYVEEVYNSYERNKIEKRPGHDPILKNILIKDDDSIAIEVPIWRKIGNDYITGHIDLIQANESSIRIIDYKPEGHFLHTLPQVASYGLIFKSIFAFNNITCVSFNKKEAWEYQPEILIKDIKDYLIPHRINLNWEKYIQ